MSKRLYAILTIAILALLPLMADNQVVMSTRAQSLTSSAEADDTLSWQGYTDQLGLSVPETMDYDLLQTKHLVTARGDASYPVTPGDIYQLNYLYNGSLVTVPVVVTHSDEVSVANIGSFSRLGKTFDEFRREVEGAVTSRYPYSSPSLSLTATGSFTVRVAGYVTSSQAVDAWGLTRLSDLAWYASDMASTRDVVVTHSDGTSAHYDLYAARLGGDSSQDPCLRAGDTVTFTRRGTTVAIAGSVSRPGTYQILEGDGLRSVIDSYAQGLNSFADSSTVRVQRFEDGRYVEHIVSYEDDFALLDGDRIVVETMNTPMGSVTLEGALQSSDTTSSSNTVYGTMSTQYFFRFVPGDTIEDMLVSMSPYFTTFSDLDGCYMTRDGQSRPVSFRNILYGDDPAGDIVLENGDRFTIPFASQVVTVNGAVNNPGTYAYVPGKDVSYYVNLAGGLSSSARGLDKYKLYNSYGEKIDDASPITAETTIEMEVSNFERDLGIAVTSIGLVATILGIVTSVINIASGNT